MTSQVLQASEFKQSKLASLSLAPSEEEAIAHAKKAGTLLESILEQLELGQVTENDTAKNTYEECLQLKTYLSQQLTSNTHTDGSHDIQNAQDILTRAIISYEMMRDAAEGDWDMVDMEMPSL